MLTDLPLLPTEELAALANQMADTCRAAAGRGDHAADAAAFEQLLLLLGELERRET
jgi:hypothetical protein